MLKRGQFFLIAALLISGMTIGFGTVYNEAKIDRSDAQVYELSEEIHSEIQQAYDSGVVNTKSEEQIQADIKNLTRYYAEQNPDSDFEVIFGDDSSLSQISTSEGNVEEPVIISQGSEQTRPEKDSSVTRKDNDVTLCMKIKENVPEDKDSKSKDGKVCKDFKIQKGQNFYLVVKKKVKNEQVVIYR